MNGYMVVSVNMKNIKQITGLDSKKLNFTPVLAENNQEIVKSFKKLHPDEMILVNVPLDVMKKNIKLLEQQLN